MPSRLIKAAQMAIRSGEHSYVFDVTAFLLRGLGPKLQRLLGSLPGP